MIRGTANSDGVLFQGDTSSEETIKPRRYDKVEGLSYRLGRPAKYCLSRINAAQSRRHGRFNRMEMMTK